jgi:hypothetical protein
MSKELRLGDAAAACTVLTSITNVPSPTCTLAGYSSGRNCLSPASVLMERLESVGSKRGEKERAQALSKSSNFLKEFVPYCLQEKCFLECQGTDKCAPSHAKIFFLKPPRLIARDVSAIE